MDASGYDDPPVESLADLYDELDSSGIFDGNVSVINQDFGWCLSAYRDGRLVLEHLGDGGERHMLPIPKARVLELWALLVAGEIDRLLTEPWMPGYLSPSRQP